LALTFGTLLSSQGADAHRSEPFSPSRGNSPNVTRLVPRCQTEVRVPHHPPIPLDRGEPAGRRSGARPVRRSPSGGRGVDHVRSAVAAESNPLPLALPDRGPAPAARATTDPIRRSDARHRREAPSGDQHPTVVLNLAPAPDVPYAGLRTAGRPDPVGLMLVATAEALPWRPTSGPLSPTEHRHPDVPDAGRRTADPSDRGPVLLPAHMPP